MQEGPHDGVAADAVPAVSAPAAPTPLTRVSVAAAASTLLLMDMKIPLLEPPSRALRTAGSSWPPQHAKFRTRPNRSARCRLTVA